MTENDWDTLITKLRAKYCTPFIGAGAAHPSLPLGGELSELLIAAYEKSRGTCPLPERRALTQVTQFIAVMNRGDSSVPKLATKDIIDRAPIPNFDDVNEPHRLLADLALPIYLTTNYDDLLYRALCRRLGTGAGVRREIARWTEDLRNETPSAFDTGYDPSETAPVVFHLHGHTGLPLSMVLTEDDYLDFMVNASKDLALTQPDARLRMMLPFRIRRAIKTTTLLFIGYGLNDLNFRVILRGLVNSLQPSGRQFHVAAQHSGENPDDLLSYLEKYYESTLQINVFWGTSQAFCRELRERMSP